MNSLNKQDGRKGERRCVLVQGNCVLFYLIKTLRERNQADLNYSVNFFNFSMRCSLYPRQFVNDIQRKV